jgi:hypothetical protein
VKKDPRVYLAHILECAEKIERYTKSGRDEFFKNTMTQDAVIRNFEIIGEAAKRVPAAYRRAHAAQGHPRGAAGRGGVCRQPLGGRAGHGARSVSRPGKVFSQDLRDQRAHDGASPRGHRFGRRRRSGRPDHQFATAFGGGKTHTLVALSHLAKHIDKFKKSRHGEQLRQALGDRLPERVKIVAVFTNETCDATQGRRTPEGINTRTLWGELALQLGNKNLYERVGANDEAQRVPQGIFAQILRAAAPCLILLDELADYCVAAAAVPVGDTTLPRVSIRNGGRRWGGAERRRPCPESHERSGSPVGLKVRSG